MQPKARKLRHTIDEIDSLIAGTSLKRKATDYVADYQAKCQVSRQAAIDAVYRMFESVLDPAKQPD